MTGLLGEDLRLALDRVAFLEYVGRKQKRRIIVPDPWQKDLLRSNAKRVLLNTSRQVGKSTMVGVIGLHRALFFPESLVLIVAPTERQAKITFAKVARFYQAFGGIVDTTSARRMGFEFENGSQIEALPGNPNTIQGYSADLVIIDEAAFIDDELYYIMRPSLAATDGDLIMISKPNGKSGVFYEEWTEGEGWERYQVPATECPRISSAFLEEERRHMPERRFMREYMCAFVETEDSAFDHTSVEAAFSGVDWSPFLLAPVVAEEKFSEIASSDNGRGY